MAPSWKINFYSVFFERGLVRIKLECRCWAYEPVMAVVKSLESLKMISYFYILECIKLFCFPPHDLLLMDAGFINQL